MLGGLGRAAMAIPRNCCCRRSPHMISLVASIDINPTYCQRYSRYELRHNAATGRAIVAHQTI
jgi:hypothetical protein